MTKKAIIRSALGFFIFLFSSLAWLFLSRTLNNGPDWLEKALWSLAAFLFLGVVSGLAYLIEERWALFYVLPVLVILPAIIFLKESLATGSVLAAALAFMVLAAWRGDFEKSLRIEFVSWIILKKSLGPFITALALITTLFFYFAPFTQSLEEKIYVPRPLFDIIVQPTANLFLQLTLPVGQAPLRWSQNVDNLPPEVVRQQAELVDKLYISVNEGIASAGQAIKKWLPLGVSVSLFFSFKIIGTFLSWLMIPLAWLALRILLGVGLVKIEKVAAEREVVIM